MPRILLYGLFLAVVATHRASGQDAPSKPPKEPGGTPASGPSKSGEALTRIPLIGDEISLADVIARRREYVGRPIIVAGGIRVQGYYNFSYANAESTHYSLDFTEMTADVKPTGPHADLYLQRSLGKALIDETVKSSRLGFGKAVRLRIVLDPERFDPDSGIMADVLDWQFVNETRDGWTPWAVESQTREKTQNPDVYWKGDSNKLYHVKGCDLLKNAPRLKSLPLSDAKAKGLRACKKCSAPK